MGVVKSENDALDILRTITPRLGRAKHKGQGGTIGVIGGCWEYTGASYFAAISALKTGADICHIFCSKEDAPVIKRCSHDLIVHPILEYEYSPCLLDDIAVKFAKWIERLDCLVVGPGLGPGRLIQRARESNVPIVVDGDGFDIVTNNLDTIKDYPLAVLTPNLNEYEKLVQKVLNCPVHDRVHQAQLSSLAEKLGGVTILLKGRSDYISDGDIVESVSIDGSFRRCLGQGDILSRVISGRVAVFIAWARHYVSTSEDAEDLSIQNPMVLGCIAGSALLRKAAALAFNDKKRSTLAGDIIECLGKSMEDISPATH